MFHRRIATTLMLAFLIIPALLPAGIVSAMIITVPILIFLNPLGNKSDFGFIHFVWPLLLLFFIGSHGFLHHDPYNFFKDSWYIVNPIATLVTGYLLMIYVDDLKTLLNMIVIAAIIIAIFHLS